jgi:ComF family protein
MAILSSDHVKMTSILEKAISVIAPFRCIVCSNYNNVLCTACTHAIHRLEAPLCVLCGTPSSAWELCGFHGSPLSGIYAAGVYESTLKALITQFKFEHARAAYKPLAAFLMCALPHFDNSWVVVAIPTIPAHVRRRSYDHAALLAREVARVKGLRNVRALVRQHDARQVGATRQQRAESACGAFSARGNIAGKKVLIIDDVCTTGATLQSAAATLKAAGAAEVWGAVAAWQPPK